MIMLRTAGAPLAPHSVPTYRPSAANGSVPSRLMTTSIAACAGVNVTLASSRASAIRDRLIISTNIIAMPVLANT